MSEHLPSAEDVERVGLDPTLRTMTGSGPDGAFTWDDVTRRREALRHQMSRSMDRIGSELRALSLLWEAYDLPSDFLSGEEYPFTRSLDEVAADVQRAADLLAEGLA